MQIAEEAATGMVIDGWIWNVSRRVGGGGSGDGMEVVCR